MPMYLLLVICLLALFVAVVFYLFYAPGKNRLINSTSGSTMLIPPSAQAIKTPAGQVA